MKEDENQEYISITFDLKPPKDSRHNIINTIALLLSAIEKMEDYEQWNEMDTQILNTTIEQAKAELDNLKIIKFEEDNLC